VTGPVASAEVTLADAHAHAWIDPPAGVESGPRLTDEDAIVRDLAALAAAGGSLLVDCQPGGCGRDANRLAAISQRSGLHITATTGFHRRDYYPADHWLWNCGPERAAAYFITELVQGMLESTSGARATTIKVGHEGHLSGRTGVLAEAAAAACRATGALILIHTERGLGVEELLPFFADRGVPAGRLYLCHMDKRPDLGLHAELAEAGVLLGYDTFLRPKYQPERHALPLLCSMIERGHDRSIAVGLDLAEASLWPSLGSGPGPAYLATELVPRLRRDGVPEEALTRVSGGNIARRLVPTRPASGEDQA